jgi:hypothetical protein
LIMTWMSTDLTLQLLLVILRLMILPFFATDSARTNCPVYQQTP